MADKKYYVKYRKERLINGLCLGCGERPPTDEFESCEICRTKHTAYRKDRRLKVCGQCGKEKENKRASLCNTCLLKDLDRVMKTYQYRKEHKLCVKCGAIKNNGKAQCDSCLEKRKLRQQRLKITIINHYGGTCQCCQESDISVLVIDHIDDDGASHRKKVGKGNVYDSIRQQNFPPGFQVLCANCNIGKYMGGGICIKHGKILSTTLKPKRKISKKKLNLLEVYGKQCVCCSESQLELLCMDHINDDGSEHRKKKGAQHLYNWAKENNFPKVIQTLCANCNMSKELSKKYTCNKHQKYLGL